MTAVLRAFRWAFGFLTIAPIAPRKPPLRGELGRAAPFFPLVGAVVGLCAFGIDTLAGEFLPSLVRALLVVGTGIILTRGLHLDGLADTADGLASMRDREGTLGIMRDPHIGTFGAAIVMTVILLKTACIHALPEGTRLGPIVAAAVASRLSMVFGGWLFRYARARGKASDFTGHVRTWGALLATAMAAACAWGAGGVSALVTLGVGAGVGLAASGLVAIKLRGSTGDTLGASGEVAETAALVWAVAWIDGL